MKPAVAITLIITGALIFIAPIASDYLYQGRLVEAATTSGGRGLLEGSRHGWPYTFSCYALGILMIVVGAAGSSSFRFGVSSE